MLQRRIIFGEKLYKKKLVLTGLAVGEDAGIVSLEGVVEDVDPERLEDLLLAGVVGVRGRDGVEAVVERKVLCGFPTGNKEKKKIDFRFA